ncbi:hypothetical protein [Methylobacterium soli]|uniref:Uncharacterized protein n=1 Tax=Methylobacterium soli TaxID=553447 RepID=A0A6L3SRU7_9HYPH|nr:hypothetical protein [Methylobacterium soli]KAB1072227.1 hypothetical protein F6X53_28390 [Methylobacterium soli]GJE45693.1 hypothetical protein AEGHOMDF_4893 [Methylobacterium soli]
MSDETRELTLVMIAGIALDRALTHEFSKAAADFEAEGATDAAAALRSRARYHQVKALELQGRLAVLAGELDWAMADLFKAD